MYEEFFGLVGRPFPSVPDVDCYCPTLTSEAARITLDRCIRRGEGTGLLIGAAGMGKTLLLRILSQQLDRSLQVVLLSSGRLESPRALLQSVLFQLGRPYRRMDEGELRLELHSFLNDRDASPKCLALLVDEAHGLKLRVLEEIRMLTNIDDGPMPRVRVVLAGNTLLEEHLTNPKLDSFSQRIASRCYLEALEHDETIKFIRSQLRMADIEAPYPLSEEACIAVHRATGGVPRLIHQLCDHALLLAYDEAIGELDDKLIEHAWADLQQLPSPWNRNPWASQDAPAQAQTSVIEFGGLDDDSPAPAETSSIDEFDVSCDESPAPLLPAGQLEEQADAEASADNASEAEFETKPLVAETAPTFTPAEEQPVPSVADYTPWLTETHNDDDLDVSYDPIEAEFGNPFEEVFEEEEVISHVSEQPFEHSEEIDATVIAGPAPAEEPEVEAAQELEEPVVSEDSTEIFTCDTFAACHEQSETPADQNETWNSSDAFIAAGDPMVEPSSAVAPPSQDAGASNDGYMALPIIGEQPPARQTPFLGALDPEEKTPHIVDAVEALKARREEAAKPEEAANEPTADKESPESGYDPAAPFIVKPRQFSQLFTKLRKSS